MALLNPDIPHFSLPFRFLGANVTKDPKSPSVFTPTERSAPPPPELKTIQRVAVEEQDDDVEILHCVEVILRYPKGFRVDDPEFGTPDQLFKVGGANEDDIKAAIAASESRIEAIVEVDRSRLDQLISDVQISLREKGDEGAGVHRLRD